MENKYDQMQKAIDRLVADPSNGVHRAYIGLKNDTGEECIVCVVPAKRPLSSLSSQEVIPHKVRVETDDGFEEFPTDVEQAPPAEIQILRGWRTEAVAYDAAIQNLRSCQQPTIKGGSQIAPIGAQWVGTLGCAVIRNGTYGALTNYHVAHGGRFGQGAPIGQPHGQSPRFGAQSAWINIDFRGGDNLVDASFVTGDTDSGGGIVVIPEQHDPIGRIDPRPWNESEVRIGMQVQKVGRTTGYQRGKVVGIRNTSYVGYGQQGTGKFVRQFVIRADSGDFSAGGDSGSLILDMDRRPVALLFAGGGRDTIANPIQFVIEKLGIKFF